jgi:predicted dehydrogenase
MLDRRHFLKTSALVATTALGGRLSATPSNQLNLALIGTGHQGRRNINWFSHLPCIKVTCLCDINPLNVSEAQKMLPDALAFEDWRELLSIQNDIQAVVVALPEHLQAPVAIGAMEAGMDVFCESPMAISNELAKRMISTRDRTNRILHIGQQRRCNPLYHLAEQLIKKEGIIGELQRIDANCGRSNNWSKPLPNIRKSFNRWGYPTVDHLINWHSYREYGHGPMTQDGIHQIAISSWLLGDRRPLQVWSDQLIRCDDFLEPHGVLTAGYLFEGSKVIRFEKDSSLIHDNRYGELLIGSEGSIRISAEQTMYARGRNGKETQISIEGLGDIELGGVVSTSKELKAAEANLMSGGLRDFSYVNERRIFANAVRNRRATICTGEIGHHSMVLAVSGVQSQHANQIVSFSPEMFI